MESKKISLFAVLVGINSYYAGDLIHLRGSVADVKAFNTYLKNKLDVPSAQIVVLNDSEATREAIIAALVDLCTDPRIQDGDAILFYYAGHGTQLEPPPNWQAGGRSSKIQAIVPYDYDTGEEDKKVRVIPDFMLGTLLSKIAQAKGDNITVIFDCCYSSSGTRDTTADNDVRVRSAKLASPVWSEYLNMNIMGTNEVPNPKAHLFHGLRSHTLISACGEDEKAHEDGGHGRFSKSLLALLNRVPPEHLRYSDILIHPLFPRLLEQRPHCEVVSNFKHRTLFNRKVKPSKHWAFEVEKTADKCIVKAGTIHKITKNTEFYVHSKSSSTTLSHPIGTLVAAEVGPFSSLVHSREENFDLTQPVIATIKTLAPQEFKIRIPTGNGFADVFIAFKQSESRQKEFGHITLATNPEETVHIELSLVTTDTILLKMHTRRGLGDEIEIVQRSIDNNHDDLARVLSAAIHFYGELENCQDDPTMLQDVTFEFYQLTEDHNMGWNAFSPTKDGINLYKDGKVKVHMTHDGSLDNPVLYGILLDNKGGNNLHANVFFFDHRELSITTCHEAFPDNGHDGVDPQLKAGGSLAIGYHNSAYPPFCFNMADGVDVEVGILKVYLTTEQVDLAYIAQDTPFVVKRSIDWFRGRKKKESSWASITIPVIQHRQPLVHSNAS